MDGHDNDGPYKPPSRGISATSGYATDWGRAYIGLTLLYFVFGFALAASRNRVTDAPPCIAAKASGVTPDTCWCVTSPLASNRTYTSTAPQCQKSPNPTNSLVHQQCVQHTNETVLTRTFTTVPCLAAMARNTASSTAAGVALAAISVVVTAVWPFWAATYLP